MRHSPAKSERPMKTLRSFIDKIQKERKILGLTYRMISDKSGVRIASVHSLLTGGRSPCWLNVEKIANAFGWSQELRRPRRKRR